MVDVNGTGSGGTGSDDSSLQNDNEGGATEGASQDGQLSQDGSGSENSSQEEGAEGQQASGGESLEDIEVVEKDGKRYIPQEAFEKRIAKIVAQRNEARTILESIKNDPNVRREFMQTLSSEAENNSSNSDGESNSGGDNGAAAGEASQPTAFKQFLGTIPAEHHDFYTRHAQALGSEVESYVSRQLETFFKKNIAPLKEYVGQSTVSEFAKKNPDFGKHERAIAETMRRKPTLEEAYILQTWKDKVKAAQNGSAKNDAVRKAQQARNPIVGKSSSGGNFVKSKPKSLEESINNALDRHSR